MISLKIIIWLWLYTTNIPLTLKSIWKIFELGLKSKAVINSSVESDEVTFSSIIPLYELTASALYNSAITITDQNLQTEKYEHSLEWFGYLDGLNDKLSETLWMKKANAYRNIYIVNNDKSYLDRSVGEFEALLDVYPDSFRGRCIWLCRIWKASFPKLITTEIFQKLSIAIIKRIRWEKITRNSPEQSFLSLDHLNKLISTPEL